MLELAFLLRLSRIQAQVHCHLRRPTHPSPHPGPGLIMGLLLGIKVKIQGQEARQVLVHPPEPLPFALLDLAALRLKYEGP